MTLSGKTRVSAAEHILTGNGMYGTVLHYNTHGAGTIAVVLFVYLMAPTLQAYWQM